MKWLEFSIPAFKGKFTFVVKRLFLRLVEFIISRDIRKPQQCRS